jgi:hypothetical protein
MFREISLTSLLFFSILARADPTVQLGSTTLTGAAFGNLEFFGGMLWAANSQHF